MALAYDAVSAASIFLTLRDEAQNAAVKEFVVPTTVWDPATDTIVALEAIRDNLVTALNAITDSLVYRAYVTLRQQEDTAQVGGAGSEIENIASVVTNLETNGKTAVLQIPAPNIGIFQNTTGKDKNIIDKTDAALLTFIGLFQTTGGSLSISDGETIADTTPIDAGKRIHRKSRRG